MAVSTTRKQLVNKVLRRLREDELTDSQVISDEPYAETIGDFINDTLDEIQDAWNWSQLRSVYSFTTVGGTQEYSIGDASNEKSEIIGMWNTTQDYEMQRMSDAWFNRHTLIGDQQNSSPSYYRVKGFEADGNLKVELYPIPSGANIIKTWVYTPQADLTADADILSLSFCERALIYGSWAKAISERGEDGGKVYDEVVGKYQQYLATAIARDKAHYSNTESGSEGDWSIL